MLTTRGMRARSKSRSVCGDRPCRLTHAASTAASSTPRLRPCPVGGPTCAASPMSVMLPQPQAPSSLAPPPGRSKMPCSETPAGPTASTTWRMISGKSWNTARKVSYGAASPAPPFATTARVSMSYVSPAPSSHAAGALAVKPTVPASMGCIATKRFSKLKPLATSSTQRYTVLISGSRSLSQASTSGHVSSRSAPRQMTCPANTGGAPPRPAVRTRE
mmetsp:Transcript_12892/g.32601  ORF Transcript_12892/g.32601 Transcript_12892/m.32601 type:complete len:218 (-) Transcript_12892:243-896(-)